MDISNESIQSLFRDFKIDEDLIIYKGRFCLYSNSRIRCDGVLYYKITDPAALGFRGTVHRYEEIEQPIDYENVKLEVVGYKIIDAEIVNISNGVIEGFINDHIIKSKDVSCDYIQFDIINMDKIPGKLVKYGDIVYAGRIKFNLNDYVIVIDKSYEYNKEMARQLYDKSGSRITHTGRIYRKDGKPIKTKNTDLIFMKLAMCLSFACGRYVCIPNAYGFLEERENYRSWYRMDSSNFNFVFKWTSTISNYHNFEKYLSLGCKKLEDDYYSNIFSNILDWYIEANTGINLANSIISIQTALEMLSYIVLVESSRMISASKFDRRPSNQNIRQLLKKCHIDCTIPINGVFSQDILDNFEDGVDLITYFRNTIVHPSKSKRKIEAGFEDMYNSILLGVSYMELVILYLFGYKGEYTNRFKDISFGDVENVPWS